LTDLNLDTRTDLDLNVYNDQWLTTKA